MHIALSLNTTKKMIGAVAFDFDRVLEPHEHLQRDMLVYSGTSDDAPKLSDWMGRNIGKRAFVWANDPLSSLGEVCSWFEYHGVKTPWKYDQWGDIHTLAWAAQHVLGSEFHVPSIEFAGLMPEIPLHAAATNATLVQAALRALILHERRFGPGKSTYPKQER